MRMSLIPPGMVAETIPQLLPHLKTSQEWTKGRSTVDDILRFILNGQMQLWVGHEEGKIYGHVITEIKQYPQCRMLVVQYCAGEPNHMKYSGKSRYPTFFQG